MIVNRDFIGTLGKRARLEAVMLWGPRQVGKTTLLELLEPRSVLRLDDLALRHRAQEDPALALDDLALPCLIDEAQYAPNLFPEIKLRIDAARRAALAAGTPPSRPAYYLTGSNRTLLDRNVKESLAGRCHHFTLLGLSIKELVASFPDLPLKSIMYRGGFPELYTRAELEPRAYLNDYILSFVEKDIAFSAGVAKLGEFHTVLRLLAAQSGQFLNTSEVAGAAGVDSKTVTAWLHMLQRNFIVDLVPPFASNLSKRITKMSKLYFLDTGLCSRLQGHTQEDTLWHSVQAGSLFETLVFAEIVKTRDNFLRDWQLFVWRTKERAEIDFVLQHARGFLFLEVKLGIHGARPFELDKEAVKVFSPPYHKVVVTAGNRETTPLDRHTVAVPLSGLGEYLLAHA